MVDVHSHIIWDIDDGAKSKDMTMNMLEIAIENGTRKIIATPHFYTGVWEHSHNEVDNKVKEIKKIIEENSMNIDIYSGQEVYYSEKIVNYYNRGLIRTINNSRYMLIELPINMFDVLKVIDNLYEIQLKGIVPIIAHPERYNVFINKPKIINKFIESGFLFQLNSGSLEGLFGKNVKKTANIFLENKIYSLIGSDAHRDKKRDTNLSRGISIIEKRNREYINIFINNGESVIDNREIMIDVNNIVKMKKWIFGKVKI